MRGRIRFSAASTRRWAAFGLILGLCTGCGEIDMSQVNPAVFGDTVKVLRIAVPSFDDTPTTGVRLWRRGETGDFEVVSEILLSEPFFEEGLEYVGYTLLDPQGNAIELPLTSLVERDADDAELALWIVRFAPAGEFKASVFNHAGDSGLSAESTLL